MSDQTTDYEYTAEQAAADVALDVQGAYRNMLGRARECDSTASMYEESARRERILAIEYRAKAEALAANMETLGIEVPQIEDPDAQQQDEPVVV